ncbi:MAG: TPM domain-containing protein [Thermomicrobiales bacterium]|nr:TPM domain-containing protein [Thermomicrobiales bacterium]
MTYRILTLVLIALLGWQSAQAAEMPTLLVSEGLFSESQLATLQRDADLAQRSGVPILFVVVSGDGTSAGSAQSYAETMRTDYSVETSQDADDGIVFVVHWVANDPTKSVVVYSAGEHAFATTGLSEETIDSYIDKFVIPRLQNGKLFEASAFLIRLTRATSLYAPPPARAIAGAAQTTQNLLRYLAPTVVLGVFALAATRREPSAKERYAFIGAGLGIALMLAALSMWSHSRIGIAGLIAIVIALLVWGLWTTHTPLAIDWRRLAPDIVIVLALIGTSLWINWQQVEITPGDRDETRWINRAYYAADLADPFGPTWQDYVITVGQPPLGSIAIGIGMALQHQDLRATGVWDYQYDRNWYTAIGGYPTDEAMTAARRTNAVIGALATGAAYVLARLLTNRIGGVAAGVYLAWHPLHIVLSTQALSDETFALMLLLALIAAYRFAEKPTWGRALLLGMLLGLGGATKLTPLLLAPPLAGFGLLRLWFDRSSAGRRAGWMLIAQPFIAFATFVAVYPWLWENPVRRTWRLFAFRSSEMDAQTSAWPNALVENPLDALAHFGYKLTYTHSTSQKALQHIYDWLGIERTAVGFDLVLAAAGIVLLLWHVGRYGLWTPHALVAILMAGEIAILALGMKADFYRYHLPVVMIVSALSSYPIGIGWEILCAWVSQRRTQPTPEIIPEEAIA